jgi:hypothetical protein
MTYSDPNCLKLLPALIHYRQDTMSSVPKVSFGALGRLVTAGAAAFTGAAASGEPVTAALAAFGTVAAAYLTNRANAKESELEAEVLASKNHHLQLVLAGAFRQALAELAPLHPTHEDLFNTWQALLDAALDRPTTLLPIVIPTEFDPLLDAANPHIDQPSAFEEAESLLLLWLAYQRAFERTGSYPVVPPSPVSPLPAGLHASLESEFLPAFQKAFAGLLLQNNSEYARRAFERRHLQEQTAILRRLDAQLLIPLATLSPPQPIDPTRELEILRADNRAIPVFGRRPDLAGLRAWLSSPAPVSCRILIGPAGAGKTRLAYQLLEELEDPEWHQWHAGFLRESGFTNINRLRWDQPTLAIVDYAATAVEPLKAWLSDLDQVKGRPPLRVLLLERDANPESGWLRDLADYTSAGRRIQASSTR